MSAGDLDLALDPATLSGGLFDTGPIPVLTPEAIADLEAELDAADRNDWA
jgi:aspartate ammonia-lyase